MASKPKAAANKEALDEVDTGTDSVEVQFAKRFSNALTEFENTQSDPSAQDLIEVIKEISAA